MCVVSVVLKYIPGQGRLTWNLNILLVFVLFLEKCTNQSWNPHECFIPCVSAASTPAPHQSCSSDCPPSQASDPPTDHSPVDPEGNASSSSAKEEQSVSADSRGVTSQSIKSRGFDLTAARRDATIYYCHMDDVLSTTSHVITPGVSCD